MSGEARIRMPLPTSMPTWMVALLASKSDPYKFVTEVIGVLPYGVPNPDGLDQLELWQSEALCALRDGETQLSIRSGHGVGKGAFIAWGVLWGVSVFDEVTIPVAANTQDQLKHNNWKEITKWHAKLPGPLRDQIVIEAEKITKKGFPLVIAIQKTANKSTPEALAGIHAKKVIFFIDEASGIPEIVFETAIGALSTPGAIQVLTSNPTRRSGHFHDTHHRLRSTWWTKRVNCEDIPRARNHIQKVIDTWGKDSNRYRVRVLGEFPNKDDDTIIPLELIEAAVGRQVNGYNVYPIWGVDVGRKGSDPSALAKRRGNHLLEKVKEWKNLEGDQLAGRIIAEYWDTDEDLRPSDICVDIIGVGASAYDFLKPKNSKLPCRVHGINVSETSARLDNCFKVRDELWWLSRLWFQAKDCFIPRDEGLMAELSTPTYDFTGKGLMIAESKDDMMARTSMPSPNRADAFNNTFAVRETVRVSAEDKHRRSLRSRSEEGSGMAA